MSSAAHVKDAATQKEIDEWLSRIDEIHSAISEHLNTDINEEYERKKTREEKRNDEAKRLARERTANRYDPNRYKRFEDDKLIEKMLVECDEPPKPKYQTLTDLTKFEMVSLREAEKCKASGNEALKNGNVAKAEEYYSNAIGMGPVDEDLLLVLHNNRAQVNLLLQSYSNAVSDASYVLRRQPHNTKALLRRSKALLHLQKPREAMRDIKTLLISDPKNNEGLKMMAIAEDELLEMTIIEQNLLSNNDLNDGTYDGDVGTKSRSTYQQIVEHCHNLRCLVWELARVLEEKEVPSVETAKEGLTLSSCNVSHDTTEKTDNIATSVSGISTNNNPQKSPPGTLSVVSPLYSWKISDCLSVGGITVQMATDEDIDTVLRKVVVCLYSTARLLGCGMKSVNRSHNYGKVITEDYMGHRATLRIHGGLSAVRDIACLLLLPQQYEVHDRPNNTTLEKKSSEIEEKAKTVINGTTTVIRKRSMVQFKRLPGHTAGLICCMKVLGACYGSSKVARRIIKEAFTSTVILSDVPVSSTSSPSAVHNNMEHHYSNISKGKPCSMIPVMPMNIIHYSADAIKGVAATSTDFSDICGNIELCTVAASFLASVVAEESGFGCESVFGGNVCVPALPLRSFVGALDNVGSVLKKALKAGELSKVLVNGIASYSSQLSTILACFESLLQVVVSLLSNHTALIGSNYPKLRCRDILNEKNYYRTSVVPACLVALSFYEHAETTKSEREADKCSKNTIENITLFETVVSLLLLIPSKHYTTVGSSERSDTLLKIMKLLVPLTLDRFASICKTSIETLGYFTDSDVALLGKQAHSSEALLSIFYNFILEEKLVGPYSTNTHLITEINNKCPSLLPSCLTIIKACQLTTTNDNSGATRNEPQYLLQEHLPVVTRILGVLGKMVQLLDKTGEEMAEEDCSDALWKIFSYTSSAQRRTVLQLEKIQKLQCDYNETNVVRDNQDALFPNASLTSLQMTVKYQADAIEHLSMILCHVYWKKKLRALATITNTPSCFSDSDAATKIGMTGAERIGLLLDHFNFKIKVKISTDTPLKDFCSVASHSTTTFETNSVMIGNVALILNTLCITDYVSARRLGGKGVKMVTVASIFKAKDAIKKVLDVIVPMMSAIEDMEKEQRQISSSTGSKRGNIDSDGEKDVSDDIKAHIDVQRKAIKNARSALSNIGIMISGWVQKKSPPVTSASSDVNDLAVTLKEQHPPYDPYSDLCNQLRELRGFEILGTMLKMNPNAHK